MPNFVNTSVGYVSYETLLSGMAASGVSYTNMLAYLNSLNVDIKDVPNIARDVQAWKVGAYKNGRSYFTASSTFRGNRPAVLSDSNTATPTRGTLAKPVQVTKDPTTGKARFSKIASKINASRGLMFVADVGTAACLAAVGIQAGRFIDQTLYNANPDFWDSIGAGSLNPETWSNITSGINAPGMQATVDAFNFLFDIDPDTGEAQAYIDEQAFHYMMAALANGGALDDEQTRIIYDPDSVVGYTWNYPASNYNRPMPVIAGTTYVQQSVVYGDITFTTNANVYFVNAPTSTGGTGRLSWLFYAFAKEPFTLTATQNGSVIRTQVATKHGDVYWVRYATSFYYYQTSSGLRYEIPTVWGVTPSGLSSNNKFGEVNDLAHIFEIMTGAVQGGGLPVAPGATVISPAYVDTPEEAATYLPTVFPGMYADPVIWDTTDPETGETERRRYLPIPFPNISSALDPNPLSGTSTQQLPDITPDADTMPSADTLAKLLQDYLTDTTTPPPNPERTGDGTTPPIVVPVGSASALWSVYHPTQAQLNQFGGWLWSSNFVDQLLKVFNNPMESLIGLHKIYAQPVDAGSSTIAVGYLNSNVPSATVTQQYVYVDCGSVSCLEEFGNVFDYPPYTTVKLYLPFVGIVPLDVAEVMRSTISVRYGVDVFTGACLAMVRVSRDGGGGVLYQYAGNCAVQYPLSSGSYMGIVSGILSVAGGVAATLATGGGAAPIALGVAGGAMAAHTSVQNSGSFAGNSGAMGGKIPYLVIQRPQSMMEYDYTGMRGAPANYTVQVRNCEGFIKAKSVKRLEAHATSEELEEIEQWLLEGVIV